MAVDTSKYGKTRVIGQQSVYVDKTVYRLFADFCTERFPRKIGYILTDLLEDFVKSQSEGPVATESLPPAVRDLVADLCKLDDSQLRGVAGTVRRLIEKSEDANGKSRKLK